VTGGHSLNLVSKEVFKLFPLCQNFLAGTGNINIFLEDFSYGFLGDGKVVLWM